MFELQKIYAKIAKPLAFVFAAFALLILIDYLMPRDVSIDTVQSQRKKLEHYSRRNGSQTYAYYMSLSGREIQTDEYTYRNVYNEDVLEVHKTSILRKTTNVYHTTNEYIDITVYEMPYTNFPLCPILFFLPIVFAFIKGEAQLLIVARPVSNAVALLCLLMTFVW